FMLPPPPIPTLFPYTTLFRSLINELASDAANNSTDSAAKQDSPILMYQKIMPAGVARQTTLPNQQQKLQQQCQEFKEQLIANGRSEEHTSELQSRENLVCRLL